MKRSRFTKEQVIGILKEHHAGLATAGLCRNYGVGDATFCKRPSRFGGMEVSDAKWLKALADENAKLNHATVSLIFSNGISAQFGT